MSDSFSAAFNRALRERGYRDPNQGDFSSAFNAALNNRAINASIAANALAEAQARHAARQEVLERQARARERLNRAAENANAANRRMETAGSAIDFLNQYSGDLSAARPGTSSGDVLSQPAFRRAITNTRKAAEEAKRAADAYDSASSFYDRNAGAARDRADAGYDKYISRLRSAENALKPRNPFAVDYAGAIDNATREARSAAEKNRNAGKEIFSHSSGKFGDVPSAAELEQEQRDCEKKAADLRFAAYGQMGNPETQDLGNSLLYKAQKYDDAAERAKRRREELYGEVNEQRKTANRAWWKMILSTPTVAPAPGYEDQAWADFRKKQAAWEPEDAKLRAMGGAGDYALIPGAVNSAHAGYLNALGTVIDYAHRYNTGAGDPAEWANDFMRAQAEPNLEVVDKLHNKADALRDDASRSISGMKAGRGRLGRS